jgi:hypothetical protein
VNYAYARDQVAAVVGPDVGLVGVARDQSLAPEDQSLAPEDQSLAPEDQSLALEDYEMVLASLAD